LHTPLVMVLGHDKCGAVTAAVERVPTNSHVQAVVDALRPALTLAEAQEGDRVSTTIDANVRYAVKTLHASEPVLMSACAAGHLRIVGARYNLDTGEVGIIA
jgi:carbonic anhydrase